MSLQILLLGVVVGFFAIAPPGPVAFGLLEVGIRLGRSGGVRGGLGIVGGDAVVAGTAAAVVLAGGALPAGIGQAIGIFSVAVLIGLGALMLLRPTASRTAAARVTRPARAFFLITALTPSVFGMWIALIAALPFAQEGGAVAAFVLGAILASLTWHLFLGAFAAEVGARVDDRVLRLLTRSGGVVMIAIGTAAAL